MERHVKNYLEAFGFDGYSFMPCELCGAAGVEIHHVEPRSKFGSKMKHLQDHVNNLVCLCRKCHDKAHNSEDTRIIKDQLKEIILSRNPIKTMKKILILSLLFLSLSCADEPQISKAHKGAKMITYEEAVTKGHTEPQPVCQNGICCWQGGGGAPCWRDPR